MFTENDRYLWDRSGTNEEVARLERLLSPLAHTPRPLLLRAPAPPRHPRWHRNAIALLATAATLTSVVLGAATYRFTWQDGQPWEGYVSTSGDPAKSVALGPGDVLRTDSDATAVLDIARIGTLTVLPGSVVELVETRTGQHRVELRTGAVRAKVWAPPWHFGISLGSTQVVDLGCEFELRREPGGRAVLRVYSGWVQLHGEVEAVVPAGAVAVVDPERGPGTPFRTGATGALRAALAAVDARSGAVHAAGPEVRSIVAETGPSDAITLVSLLSRYPHLARGPLFEHTHTMLPAGAMPDRARVVAGDTKALAAWWDALPYPAAKRWWLHWRDALDPSPAQASRRDS